MDGCSHAVFFGEPVDDEAGVAVELESLVLELEGNNDDESVILEKDDEDDMFMRDSHALHTDWGNISVEIVQVLQGELVQLF